MRRQYLLLRQEVELIKLVIINNLAFGIAMSVCVTVTVVYR